MSVYSIHAGTNTKLLCVSTCNYNLKGVLLSTVKVYDINNYIKSERHPLQTCWYLAPRGWPDLPEFPEHPADWRWWLCWVPVAPPSPVWGQSLQQQQQHTGPRWACRCTKGVRCRNRITQEGIVHKLNRCQMQNVHDLTGKKGVMPDGVMSKDCSI